MTCWQALCTDKRLLGFWSSGEVLSQAACIINDSECEECSIPPFLLTCDDSEDVRFFRLPDTILTKPEQQDATGRQLCQRSVDGYRPTDIPQST